MYSSLVTTTFLLPFPFSLGDDSLSTTHSSHLQSVSYTAAPFFAIAAIWFVIFRICLSLICVCYCCRPREPYGSSSALRRCGVATCVVHRPVASATVDVYQYSPFLIQLEDCSYARQTFMDVETNYCPGLQKYSQRVYVGLVMVATAVILSLLFWVIYGRERRHCRHATGDDPRGFLYAKDDDDEHK